MKRRFHLALLLLLAFVAQMAFAQAPAATPQEAVAALLNRIGGNGAADKFVTVIDASLAENGKDVFVITSQDGKPCIKGNTQLSVTTGINWYLNHHAHINLTWNQLTTDLSKATLPVPSGEEKHVCNATYRYNFNTCTFSYSMAFWTWERWQQEIDWMALHGINAPLNLVGLDVVTRKFLRELGVSENDINAYIAGPGFIAWFAMNNLEGWGGTINANDVTMNGNPDWWYTRQEKLCRDMLQRMRELGMQPVIPGFSGQVPNCIVNYTINGFSSGDVVNNGTWAGGYTRPDILKPNTESYSTFAKVYYKHLHEVMGVSELYSIDPFHEGSLPSGVTNATCYPNIMAELDNYYNSVSTDDKTKFFVDEQPKWMIQYWQGVPQSGAFSAMSSYGDRFIGLDLFADNIYADNAAKWRTNYYNGRPYIYCMLHNFGGRSGLHGRLETTLDGYFQAMAKGNNCQGIGATPEGTETNPILYDMLFELPWMNSKPTADEWLEDYAHARYGTENEQTLEAMKFLKKSVWDCKVNQQGTSEAIILARPNWTVNSVSSWSTSAIYWDTQDVLMAADLLISAEEVIQSIEGKENYNYDVMDVIRQAMVDYAAELLPLINAARGNNDEYTRLYQLYLQLMLDLDEMLSYNENFKLERWTSLARNIADEVSGTTENDRNWLEWNARTQITVWSKGNTDLHDYSNRCWAGLIKDFHYKRWKKFFETNGGSFDGGWFNGFEYPWTVDFTNYNYSTVTIPNDMSATKKAVETFGNYFGRVKGNNGKNYIFPMGIARKATKSDIIPEVYRGKTVELPLIIGKNVTITSAWVDLNNDGAKGNGETLAVVDNNKVAIPADAKIGKTTAQVVYSDGTDITFNLALVEDITENRTVTAVAGANGSVAIEGADGLTVTNKEAVKIIATANTGYNFKDWTDEGGNVVSNDNPFVYYGKEAATFTANFIQDKWGVVACNGTFSGDIASYSQFIHNLTFAYHNREAETIFETTAAPTEIFNTIPQIVNVPQGASFTVNYDNGNKDGLKYCYFRAFIDINADGDFDDDGELLKSIGTPGAQNTAVCKGSVNVTLPYDMPLGITHMRLRFDGAWDNSNKPNERGAKDASIRPVYEIIINVTDKSDKAATINVETNNAEWGTVEVWTDETPDGSTGTTWNVSANIPMYLRATKTSEDVEFLGWYDHYGRLLTTDLEYSMYAREDATYTARFRKFLEICGWEIEYTTESNNIILTNVRKYGEGDLIVPETINILGKDHIVVGFNNGLFNNNKSLTSITLPKSIKFLSEKSLLNGTMTGKVENGKGTTNEANYTIYNLDKTVNVADGFKVTVSGKSDGSTFNEWGSGLFATGSNPLATTYNDGFQFYLAKAGNFVLKVDNSTENALDNSNCKVIAGTPFTATIEYKKNVITITVDNGADQTGTYTRENVTLANISAFSAAIPTGITLSVNVETNSEANPFSGCLHLDKIAFDGTCENYYVNNDGDLYNSSDVLVCSPDGKAKGADRRALGALIKQMQSLAAQVATYNPTGKANKIDLQTTNANEKNYLWANSIETSEGNIAHLVDETKGDDTNFFHTNYHNAATTEGYHFIEVDLGESNMRTIMQFSYHTRTGCTNDFPDAITVMGSNDKVNYTEIHTESEGLPQAVNKNFTSAVFDCGQPYRYLRFKVNAERIYWHMGEFELYYMTSTADVYSFLESGITNEQAETAYDAMLEAKAVFDLGTTAEQMQNAKTKLQNAYDTLNGLLKAMVPVTLTTDEANPVLYKIFIKRTADVTVLKYDESDKMVAVQDKADNSSWQTWYFMGSTNGITIHPYNADGMVLSADNTSNDPAKVWATEKGEKAFYEWLFDKQNDGYWNILAHDKSNYFSNNGGTGNKMGFWKTDPNSDGGSLFKFVEAEFNNDNPRFYQLSDVKATLTDGSNIYGGTSVGLYTGGKEYREAWNSATTLVNAGNASASADCHNAYKALRSASKNLSYNELDEEAIYFIKSVSDMEYCKDKYVHTYYEPQPSHNNYDHKHLVYHNLEDITDKALATFQFEKTGTQGQYKMKNLHTGLYVKSFVKNADLMDTEAKAQIVSIRGYADNAITLQIGQGKPMHAQQDYSLIVDWDAEQGGASLWIIEEVEDKSNIAHHLNIGVSGFSTIYLNYPVELPEGISAYMASTQSGNSIKMSEIEGTLPAQTAALLRAPQGQYTLSYTINTQSPSAESNLMKGSAYKQTIQQAEGKSYYYLANIDLTPEDGIDNKVVGFFKTETVGEKQFINSANKAYLELSQIATPSFLFFDFGNGVESSISNTNISGESVKNIFDLQGRRLHKTGKAGLYIINGKKVMMR